MKLNFYSTKDYENKARLRPGGKQSQTKPIGEDQYKTKDPRHKTKDTSLESEVWIDRNIL